jgi:hypothetical protein
LSSCYDAISILIKKNISPRIDSPTYFPRPQPCVYHSPEGPRPIYLFSTLICLYHHLPVECMVDATSRVVVVVIVGRLLRTSLQSISISHPKNHQQSSVFTIFKSSTRQPPSNHTITMAKETRIPIQTKNAPLPPRFLSQGIKVGNMIYCSGQVGVDPTTGKMVEGPIQARTVLSPSLYNAREMKQ